MLEVFVNILEDHFHIRCIDPNFKQAANLKKTAGNGRITMEGSQLPPVQHAYPTMFTW